MTRILLIIAIVFIVLFLFHKSQTGSFFGNYYAPEGAGNAQGSVGGIR